MNILILTFLWFGNGFNFYGLIINLEKMGGDVIIDTIVTFTGQIIAGVASGYFAEEYGRLIVLKISGFMGGFGFIFFELVENKSLKSLFIFITSFAFSASNNVQYIYSPEVFPTSVRSTVMGFLFLISRLGAVAVGPLSSMIPGISALFVLFSIGQSVLCFWMEETLDSDLLDDVPEMIRQKSFLTTSNVNLRKKSRMMSKRLLSKNSLQASIRADHYLKIDA